MANSKFNAENTWSLVAFAKEFGKDLKVGTFRNKEDGSAFQALIFTNEEGEPTFAHISAKCGQGITPKDVICHRKEWQIVSALTKTGQITYCCCPLPKSSWQTVDLDWDEEE